MRRLRFFLILGGGLSLLCGVALWLLWTHCGLEGCPDLRGLTEYVPDQASVVIDREGGELGQLYRVNRVVVPLDSLPPYLPAAFIAVEDQRFWRHNGVDWYRVLGAAWANLRARRVEEGFSTITMQLARNVFPEELPQTDRTLRRKWTEMRVAGEIERNFSKEEILELYLNQIYFGEGAWGVEAAALEYFGKPASELTLGEAAILAGLIRAPQRLNPRRNLEAARRRRGVVLSKMVEQDFITLADANLAAAEEIEVEERKIEEGEGTASYFLEEVRQEVESILGGGAYTGGYIIHTTLDPRAQRAAEEELEAQISAIEGGRHGNFRHPHRGPEEGGRAGTDTEVTPYLQGAVVVLDVATGDLLALVGGRDFVDSKFDRAVQAWRQPGSAFKPFVYGAALAAGYPPTTILNDEPLRLVLPDGTVWEPSNFGGSYQADVMMRDALVQSRNVATIRLAEEVGLDRVIEFARRAGLSGPIPNLPSIAIGAAETRLLELTTAYATLAALGRRPKPRMITRIEDRRGRTVWEDTPSTERAIDPAVAFLLIDLMRGVVDRGTGTPVRGAGYYGPAAGKTGTTNGSTDVWFLGATPEIAAGVWIGFDRPREIVSGATGGRLAAPVWGRIMRRIAPASPTGWAPPPGIELHWVDEVGTPHTEGCPILGELRPQYFLAGTVPPDSCSGLGYPLLGRPYPSGEWDDSTRQYRPDPDRRDEMEEDELTEERWWGELRQRLHRDLPFDEEGSRDAIEPDSGLVGRPHPSGDSTSKDPSTEESRRSRDRLDPTPRPAEQGEGAGRGRDGSGKPPARSPEPDLLGKPKKDP